MKYELKFKLRSLCSLLQTTCSEYITQPVRHQIRCLKNVFFSSEGRSVSGQETSAVYFFFLINTRTLQ